MDYNRYGLELGNIVSIRNILFNVWGKSFIEIFLYDSFIWERTSIVLGHSQFDIFWDIPETAETGIYRIRHFGSARHIFGGVFQYEGKTRTFSVA